MINKKMNIIKKIYRTTNKFLLITLIKIIYPLFKVMGITLSPPYNAVDRFKFDYSYETRRLVFKAKKEKAFNKIFIDTTLNNSRLCELGRKYSTNKSPMNMSGHRCGFTGIYNLLFSNLKDKKINFAEIGIEKNSSIKMWRDFFSLATIHAFEYDDKKIESAKKDNLYNTYYHKIDVRNNSSIVDSFQKTNSKFDIIVDDSTHIFNDQINIVNSCNNFLKENGILILEDIYRVRKGYSEADYYNALKNLRNSFSDIIFIEASHINNYTANWRNEKILFFIKNENKN